MGHAGSDELCESGGPLNQSYRGPGRNQRKPQEQDQCRLLQRLDKRDLAGAAVEAAKLRPVLHRLCRIRGERLRFGNWFIRSPQNHTSWSQDYLSPTLCLEIPLRSLRPKTLLGADTSAGSTLPAPARPARAASAESSTPLQVGISERLISMLHEEHELRRFMLACPGPAGFVTTKITESIAVF